jgi:hypothetical protein
MILPIEKTKEILINHINTENQPEGFSSRVAKKGLAKAECYVDLYTNIYNWWDFFNSSNDDSPNVVGILIRFVGLGIIDQKDADRLYEYTHGGIRGLLVGFDEQYNLQCSLGGDSDLIDVLSI